MGKKLIRKKKNAQSEGMKKRWEREKQRKEAKAESIRIANEARLHQVTAITATPRQPTLKNRLENMTEEIERLRHENDQLKSEVAELKNRSKKLETKLEKKRETTPRKSQFAERLVRWIFSC